MQPLPPGPAAPAAAQSIAFARDPLGALRRARRRHGPVFTLRFAPAGPVVVVAAPEALAAVLHADPPARAGEARRRILPLASPRSAFGADGIAHAAARGRLHAAFTREAVAPWATAIAAIAERHAASWPTGRPFRLLDRMRSLADEVVVRVVLGVDDDARVRAYVGALRRLLRTPGNPPVTPPGEGDGVLGALTARVFEGRLAPLARLLVEDVQARRVRGARGEGALDLLAAADPPLAPGEVVDELAVVLAAGQEPAAIALTSVLGEAARRPGLAARVAGAGPGDALLGAVVDETLRLRPPAMAALRRLTAPAELAGHALPAGTVVMAPTLLLHRDPQAFPDPDAFLLERPRGGGRPYFPYGGGARGCLGRHLAQAELAAAVPAVLRRVRLRPLGAPERLVQRATVLVPQRSGLVVAARQPA